MHEARDLGAAVSAAGVAYGDFDDLQIQLGRAENKIEIAERIEIAEIGAVGDDVMVTGRVIW